MVSVTLLELNGEIYRQIMEGGLLPSLSRLGLDRNNIIYQQDNDPKHTAKLTILISRLESN
jgi:hypothetical protein